METKRESTEEQRSYIAIDLKSFYASVECVERKLNPLTTNLVVADEERTEKTICLAVSPSLKSCGIPGRPRLFEVVQKVRDVNRMRLSEAIRQRKAVKGEDGKYTFANASFDAAALMEDPALELSYIVAPPRMAKYIQYSTQIYGIYLKYIAPEDIHIYSIDEVFIDATPYLNTYSMTARELAMSMIREILYTTGITATAGIGTNHYLAKIAMDIVAKHTEPDNDGVRIAELDEISYRKILWNHRPLTDFWRVGTGIARKLEAKGLNTMGDIARCSLGGPEDYYNEDLLYKLFGINAELLIDHAWGWEPCTMKEIKAYRPSVKSLGSGQVLKKPYTFEETKTVLREMADALALDLVDKGMVTDQIVLTVGYDRESLAGDSGKLYTGSVVRDRYGRTIPKHSNGSASLGGYRSSSRHITKAVLELFEQIGNPALLVRRVTLTANHVIPERGAKAIAENEAAQMSLFMDETIETSEEAAACERERRLQNAILRVKKKYGKNAMLKAADLTENATARERNTQVGGHKA